MTEGQSVSDDKRNEYFELPVFTGTMQEPEPVPYAVPAHAFEEIIAAFKLREKNPHVAHPPPRFVGPFSHHESRPLARPPPDARSLLMLLAPRRPRRGLFHPRPTVFRTIRAIDSSGFSAVTPFTGTHASSFDSFTARTSGSLGSASIMKRTS